LKKFYNKIHLEIFRLLSTFAPVFKQGGFKACQQSIHNSNSIIPAWEEHLNTARRRK
jgi:hypothetical protein